MNFGEVGKLRFRYFASPKNNLIISDFRSCGMALISSVFAPKFPISPIIPITLTNHPLFQKIA